MTKRRDILEYVAKRWTEQVQPQEAQSDLSYELVCSPEALSELCGWLFTEAGYSFAGLVVTEGAAQWGLRYIFYGMQEMGWVNVLVYQPLEENRFPSIASVVHAADWHEREAEDHFGLIFTGHPRLGDFVLHDDRWQEGLKPMLHGFDGTKAIQERRPTLDRPPRRVVRAPGAFLMPIGPVFAGATEPMHFLLETVGEDVIRTIPRLFYKYRGIEKTAEGRNIEDVFLLAERFCATSAFAHGLAFCGAAERIGDIAVPPRAQRLRVFMAELERLRHHVAAIEAICESTALAVATSQLAILQEELLRLTGSLTGHRYLFGLLRVGGMTRDLEDSDCRKALAGCQSVLLRLQRIEEMLRLSSSFLDRIEEVGITATTEACMYGLVGPVARAAGVGQDLRKVQPYCGYGDLSFEVPVEEQGDGYARLRILFAEARQSVRLIEQSVEALPTGPVNVPLEFRSGSALGWVEAPRGAAVIWLQVDNKGKVQRYRVMPPSFINWHGFHLAAENFAFQDFPIILATFDLSVAENDR